jgi:DEAD/DEAH box helicase domain-containing protein
MAKSTISQLINLWAGDPSISSSMVAIKTNPSSPAALIGLPVDIHPLLRSSLSTMGISSLYAHQGLAWQETQSGKNIVISTGTASGKTLCYQLPIIQSILETGKTTTSLLLFPTKALTQDQYAGFTHLLKLLALPESDGLASIYDGDTSQEQRRKARNQSAILLTNPDMLHLGILPYHTQWASFFRKLKYIVIDEIHMYKGVFGSNVANVLRRLKRILAFYGSKAQFIFTSATIANPLELAEKLIEESVVLIDKDGSSKGAKHFILYNPPIVDENLGIRASARSESIRLAGDLIAYDIQTLLFCHTRPAVEKTLQALRLQFPALTDSIFGYRSGYLPAERRLIEKKLKNREAKLVAATNALELGIDIGGVDSAIISGYPGSISSTFQQAGRAGRRDDESLAVLIASSNPLDQYIIRHPDYLFGNSPEKAIINPDNLLILLKHLECALFELPFNSSDSFGNINREVLQELLTFLKQSGQAYQTGQKTFWMSEQYPAANISLRSTTSSTIQLRAQTFQGLKTVGLVDEASAHWMVHPGAIYLHAGNTYLVDKLDLDEHTADLSPVLVDYYTQARSQTAVEMISTNGKESIKGGNKSTGEVLVTSQVIGFRKVNSLTFEQIGLYPLEMPKTELRTIGFWYSISKDTVEKLEETGIQLGNRLDYGPGWNAIREKVRQRDQYTCQVCGLRESGASHHVHHKTPFRRFENAATANHLDNLITLCPVCHRRAEAIVLVKSGLSGLKFTLHNLAPLHILCDVKDLDALYDPNCSFADGQPTIIFYDQIPDGVGLSVELYNQFSHLLSAAQEVISACECVDGCPACVGPNGPEAESSKSETIQILKFLL